MSRHDYKQKNVSLLWHNNKHNSLRSNASTKLAWHGSHNGAWLAGFGLQAARFTHLVQMIKAFGQSKFCQQHVVNVSENTATIVSSSRVSKSNCSEAQMRTSKVTIRPHYDCLRATSWRWRNNGRTLTLLETALHITSCERYHELYANNS